MCSEGVKSKLSSAWAPPSQESSHVGNGGVGAVSLKGAPLTLPTVATAQFARFFDQGFGSMFIAAWCGVEVHAFGGGKLGCRVLIVMLCTLEQLALTEQLGELAVVARG